MSTVFEIRDRLIEDFRSFSESFVSPKADDIAHYLSAENYKKRYWPDPLLQINPHYSQGETVSRLVDKGMLSEPCRRIFQRGGQSLTLYNHQERAISAASRGDSYVLTTGTGSGKSLSFFIPIVDHIIREKQKFPDAKRIYAILIYPMNALANSQLEEINGYLSNDPDCGITVGRYTGQEGSDERHRLAANPPDILLTNYMMMELILTRCNDIDNAVIANSMGLRFLVLDELHTYRGRQGADVAMLVRRVRQRLEADNLICVGTSATMTSLDDGARKAAAVAEVASKLFGVTVSPGNVFDEQLERLTDSSRDDRLLEDLKVRVMGDVTFSDDDAKLLADPVSVWVESKLSICKDQTGRNVRATPMSLDKVYEMFAQDSGCAHDKSVDIINRFLVRASQQTDGHPPIFAFRLHQFISGPGQLLTTLEESGKRVVTVNEQKYAPDRPEGTRLYRTYFCRDCGQEFIPVYKTDGIFMPRQLDERPDPESGIEYGYLVPVDDDQDYDGSVSTLPSSWIDGFDDESVEVRKDKRERVPAKVCLGMDGRENPAGVEYYFMPGRPSFCPSCLGEFDSYLRERTSLAGLSGEGRSSATTMITMNLLKQMFSDPDMPEGQKKILGFVDNRQDAAMQSGHFNDFVGRVVMRAATLAALERRSGDELTLGELAQGIFDVLGFSDYDDDEAQADLYIDPDLAPAAKRRLGEKVRDIFSYCILHDLNRSWVYTNPTLQHLGLMGISFDGFDEMMDNSGEISKCEVFSQFPDNARRHLMDTLLRSMAGAECIDSPMLTRSRLLDLKGETDSRLNARWQLGGERELRYGTGLGTGASKKLMSLSGGGITFISMSNTSKIGRQIRKDPAWKLTGYAKTTRKAQGEACQKLILEMLELARQNGILLKKDIQRGNGLVYYQIGSVSIRWHLGNGEPEKEKWRNSYYKALYETVAAALDRGDRSLFRYESHEHTAQVPGDEREDLEKRFRGEDGRRLPVLYCSPTMELGIDISSLNTVYLRNIPPTPANYAQRAGRAGRSGQAALVVSYSASQSPHDQWYFAHQDEMVSGSVVTPQLDLTNRELVDSHLMAIWLAESHCDIGTSVAAVLDIDSEGHPVKEEICKALTAPDLEARATAAAERMMRSLSAYITKVKAPWYHEGYECELIKDAYNRFDGAFKSWRTLYDSISRTMSEADMKLKTGLSGRDRATYDRIHSDCSSQMKLLLNTSNKANSSSSDFYIFRYLAGQGLLPGYNFPRLPVRAWIPGYNSRTGRVSEEGDTGSITSITRARFLALSEFGPLSLIYHEGCAFSVYKVKVDMSEGGRDEADNPLLSTRQLVKCPHCGYGYVKDRVAPMLYDLCPNCGHEMSKASAIDGIYRIETVETKPVSAITSMDEERQRKGYDIATCFHFDASTNHTVESDVIGSGGHPIARLRYIQGATIYKVNRGWNNRAQGSPTGFKVNPLTGVWVRDRDDDQTVDGDDYGDRPRVHYQWIVPYVEDTKNVLILTPVGRALSQNTIPTVQAAFARGVCRVFQIEESELAIESLPDNANRQSIMFYEASEGGAGVLSRLAEDPAALKAVARAALEVMHYSFSPYEDLDIAKLVDTAADTCLAGCYHCLLSYSNQTEHELIDRHDSLALDLLVSLANAASLRRQDGTPEDAGMERLKKELRARGVDIPDLEADKVTKDGIEIPFYSKYEKLAIFTDKPDGDVLSSLARKGVRCVAIGPIDKWSENVAEVESVLYGGAR